jgi:hypothetical protein
MRVRCVRLFKWLNPGYGEPMEEAANLSVGDELPVLAVLADGGLWGVGLYVLDRRGDRVWYPAGMFETISTTIPSNWVTQLWPDGSLHLAPEAWLRPGFFEGVVDGKRDGPAAREILERELAVILDEA